jgi:hypothetical protein
MMLRYRETRLVEAMTESRSSDDVDCLSRCPTRREEFLAHWLAKQEAQRVNSCRECRKVLAEQMTLSHERAMNMLLIT